MNISGSGAGFGNGLERLRGVGFDAGLWVGLVAEKDSPDLWINHIMLFLVRPITADISLAVWPSLTILMTLSFSRWDQITDLITAPPSLRRGKEPM